VDERFEKELLETELICAPGAKLTSYERTVQIILDEGPEEEPLLLLLALVEKRLQWIVAFAPNEELICDERFVTRDQKVHCFQDLALRTAPIFRGNKMRSTEFVSDFQARIRKLGWDLEVFNNTLLFM